MSTLDPANEKLRHILRAGKLFEGKYRIVKPLGAGSFAVVVHATHEVMARDVALKFLKPKVVENNPEVSERFVKEVQIASRLKHPNIVQIYDFGETEDGIYYMVQEFVDGVTLDTVLEQAPHKRLPHDRVVSIMRQVLSCLAEAHRHNIIHRDLKPSNLMSTVKDGREVIKILDFGVAKLLEPGDRHSGARQSTKFIGTPIYMSPEQILGVEVGPASDLYALGLMCYEMLTGQPPIQAEVVAEVVQQHLDERALAFSHLSSVDPLLQKIILKATQRYPERRFASAQEFAQVLDGQIALEAAPAQASPPKAEVKLSSVDRYAMHQPEDSDPDTRDDLAAFLGKNYVAMSEDDFPASTFEPLPPLSDRPTPSALPRPKLPSPSSPSSARPTPTTLPATGRTPQAGPDPTTASGLSTMPAQLELDVDALRQVKRPTRKGPRPDAAAAAQSSQLLKAPKLPSGPLAPSRLPWYLAALLAQLVCYLLITALTDGMPGPTRVLLGLFPLIGVVAWAGFGYLGHARDLASRWLIPISQRSLMVLALLLLVVALALPARAEIALTHEGDFGLSFLAEDNGLRAAVASAMRSAGAACGKLADALPWAR